MTEERDDRRDTPRRFDFTALANDEKAWRSAEDVKAAQELTARDMREQCLLDDRCGIRGAITAEDRATIIADNGLQNTHALRAVQRWFNIRSGSVQRPVSALALLGETGRGKTFAVAWLLARVGGMYITAEAMRRLFVSTHYRDSRRFDELLEQRCLVIDDVGTELDALTAQAAMFEAVNRRVGNSRAWTGLTGNITAAEFKDRYGERTVRRIEHQGAIVEVSGDDMRRRPE
jgi:DNA replication protein DnaC